MYSLLHSLEYQEKLMAVEKLGISEINKHDGYVAATKAGNTVWNARSTQVVTKDDEESKIESLEKKVNDLQSTMELLQSTLDKTLKRL
tara:strand:- start:1225 stop:1488 length:264 start_codon:yes stop_codon:yes gene_type:complete